MKVICFHSPGEPFDFLSNWYYCYFVIDGVEFNSGEQYMMYSKAVLFGDYEIARQILKEKDFGKIKALGRKVRGFSDAVWNEHKVEIMYQGLYQKFYQDMVLSQRLLATGDALLAECAVQDRVWGIGLSMKDPDRLDPRKWRGENLLGQILMRIRSELRGG